jgi:hypothetical protein
MIVFLICFLITSLLVCEKAYWFVELRFWHSIKLMNSCNISNFFVRNVYVLLCTKSHYLQMKITCPLLFLFHCLDFFLTPLLWIAISYQKRVVKMDILVLFLILKEIILVFPHLVLCWLWVSHGYSSLYEGIFLLPTSFVF